MARISGDVWDTLYRSLRNAEKRVPGILDKAIEKSGEIYTEETKNTIVGLGMKRTGVLKDSIKPGLVYRTPDGRRLEVWPQGTRYDKKHPKGERNEIIGFVNIHGRKYRYAMEYNERLGRDVRVRYTSQRGYVGKNYIAMADQRAGPKAVKAIEEMLQEAYKE